MKTIEEVIKELQGDDRKVEMRQVVDCALTTLSLLDEKSPNFQHVKKTDPKGYNGLMNTLLLSLVSNFAVIGMKEDEALEFVKGLKDKNIKSLGVAIMSRKWEA